MLGALGLAALLAVTASLVRAVESLVDRVLVAWIAGAVVLGMVGLAAGACRYFGHDLTIGLHQGDGELASRCVRPGLRASGCWQSSCSCRSS